MSCRCAQLRLSGRSPDPRCASCKQSAALQCNSCHIAAIVLLAYETIGSTSAASAEFGVEIADGKRGKLRKTATRLQGIHISVRNAAISHERTPKRMIAHPREVKAASHHGNDETPGFILRKPRSHRAAALLPQLSRLSRLLRRADPANRHRRSRSVAWKPQESSPMRFAVSGPAATADTPHRPDELHRPSVRTRHRLSRW